VQGTDSEVFKQVVYAGLDVKRVEPERKDTGFPLALGIKILDDGPFRFFQWLDRGVNRIELLQCFGLPRDQARC
jgi:hypothetical protein